MRNFKIIFQFEFLQHIKKKAVVIPTVLLMIAAFAIAALPMITNRAEGIKNFVATEGADYLNESIKGGYFVKDPQIAEELNLDKSKLFASEEELKQAVKDGEYAEGYAIYDLQNFKTYYHDKGFINSGTNQLIQILQDITITSKLEKKGVSLAEYESIQNVVINNQEEIFGRDLQKQYGLAFAYIILLYTTVLTYGSSVATAVAREKDSRTMELLITTADPKNLIMGKVVAVTIASVLQMVLIVSSALLSFFIFKGMYPKELLLSLKTMLDFSMIGVYVFYFVLGLLLYMFIFAALGSVVSRMEDVNSAITPVMFLFIASYMIAIVTLQNGNSLLAKVTSWIPFFSVMVMPIRYAVTSVAVYDIIGSTVLTVITIILLAYLSVRIYRWGTLNYGNKPNFLKVCKEVLLSKE